MERVTFHRADVKKLLSTMVCMKINAGNGTNALAKKYGVRGFPTLVLMEPGGKVLYNAGGAPTPGSFATFFAVDPFNAAVGAYNKGDWATAAKKLFFMRKWFSATKLGTRAEQMARTAAGNKAYAESYEKARAEYAARLAKARKAAAARAARTRKERAARLERESKQKERREKARALKSEADVAYKKYMRSKAYRIYKRIILEYPDSIEADAAREVLRRHKKKWKEPKR